MQIRSIKKRQKYLLVLTLLSCLIFSECNFSAKDNSIIIENHDLINASWIGTQDDSLSNETLLYEENPAPVFRKEFTVNNDIHSATLFITAAGYYSASLNGKRTGKNYLDPAWTNYAKRIYYSEYDITADIKQGGNCLGVTLGNGFYNPLPLKMWGRLNIRNFLPTGKPVFIAKLKIEYRNGETEEIITDNSWKFFYGPIIKNDVYLGEVYDAVSEIEGWGTVGFDDSNWKGSVVNKGPGGKLQKAFFPPVQITDIKVPVSISPVTNGKYLVDMGVNFTGIYRIHLKGESGDTISFRFGERIYDNGELNPMTTVAGQIKEPESAVPEPLQLHGRLIVMFLAIKQTNGIALSLLIIHTDIWKFQD